MKDSHGTYDGRKKEPAYECPNCVEKDARITELEANNEILERQSSEAHADRDRWQLVARERLDTIAYANDETKSMKRLLMKPVYKQRIKEMEDTLRSIAGAVGEFADADGKNVVEKIEFYRRDYDERIEAFRENIDSITRGADERDEVWREKKRMLENDLQKAWQENRRLREAFDAATDVIAARGDVLKANELRRAGEKG